MKRSEELLGLSIISIEDGKEVGKVKDLIINPDEGTVECLVVNDGTRYLGVHVLPSKFIVGVGEYAVTIESDTAVTSLEEHQNLSELLDKNVQVKGTKVLTKKGRLIGSVSEFFVDEDSEGKIVACELVSPNGKDSKIIPSDGVVTFGKEVLVVVEDIEKLLTDKLETGDSEDNMDTESYDNSIENTSAQEEETSEVGKKFAERQYQYLIGRKASKKIENDNGELLVEEDTVITEEILEKVKAAGKFTELSMNTKS